MNLHTRTFLPVLVCGLLLTLMGPSAAAAKPDGKKADRNEKSAGDEAAEARMRRKLPEVRFDGVGLYDAVDFLRDVSGVNIFVNWRALETGGVDRNAPVTVALKDVTLRDALDKILRAAAGGGAGKDAKATFAVVEGVVVITTPGDRLLKAEPPPRIPAPGEGGGGGKEGNGKAVEPAVLKRLARPVPEATFSGVALTNVIDFLRDVGDVNILVNWRALEATGVDRNAPTTARLRDAKFGRVLALVLESVGGESAGLAYAVSGDVLIISTPEDLRRQAAAAERRAARKRVAPPAVADALAEPLAPVKFDGVGLSDALDALAKAGGVKVAADWAGLEAAGIARDTPMTARLKAVPMEHALALILDGLGTKWVALDYVVERDGVRVVAAEAEAPKKPNDPKKK